MSATSVRMREETSRKLDELTRLTGRTKAYYLREAIEKHIDQMLYEYTLLAELEAVRAGKLETFSLDEVAANCGLES